MLSFPAFFAKNFNFSFQFLAKREKIVYNGRSVILGKYLGLDRKEKNENFLGYGHSKGKFDRRVL